MGLPSISIHRPVMTAMVFLAITVLGVISLTRLPIELYQGQNKKIISIIIRARGGLPPIEVEKRITKPIEEAVAGVTGLKNLYSNSREAESRVTMEFYPEVNMNFAALEIREKFARVRPHLPKEIEKPVIANYDDAESAVLVFAITSETLSPEEIREVVDSELKPILARVDGVASVEVYGGRERKILVELDRDKMVAYNISIEKVMDILGQSNINLLAGSVEKGTLEFGVRSMGAFKTVEEIGEIGIQATRQGSIIPLKEIGTIKDSYLEPADYARLNLEQNVTLYIKKTSISNTIPVVKTVRGVLESFEAERKDSIRMVIVTDKAETISRAISDVLIALLVGMILIVVMNYLFLRRWILAVIVSISMPVSVIATFIFMDFFDISMNVMTLSGLALAIGILVDSSVVIQENIFSKKEKGFADIRAIKEGSEEMWLALLASLVTDLIVFLPVIFIDKKIQLTYGGFAFTVSFSLIASFFVAQMLVPMLMMEWGRGRLEVVPDAKEAHEQVRGADHTKVDMYFGTRGRVFILSMLLALILKPRLWRIDEGYRRLMNWNLKWRYPIVIVLILASIIVGGKIVKRDIDWPTTLEENEFNIIIFPLAGAKLEANDDAVKRVEGILHKIPDVNLVSSTIRKDQVQIFVRLKPKTKRDYSKDEIMKIVDEKGNEAIKQIHDDYSLIVNEGESSSEQRKLIINIFGHENDLLHNLAIEFANRMNKVPGLINLVMTDLRKRPEYALEVDKRRAALYGLTVQDVADSVHAQVRGMRPTKFHDLTKGEEIETITRLQAIYRQKVQDLEFVHVASKDSGIQVPIGEIADFVPSVGPQTIDRKDKYRYVFVKGDTKRPLEAVAKDVKKTLQGVKLPDDYHWRFGGTYEELLEGKSELTVGLILTVFLVYMVLACLFESYIQPLLIMVSVPMALIGVWLALAMTHKPLSHQVFIGMIFLAGYVVHAPIILIDHMNHLKKTGKSREEILIQAGLDRLRPIVMTTLSTVLGFLPLAFNWGQSSDLWSPLAVTFIGGLISSTILTLFVVPNFILIAEELTEKFSVFGTRWLASLRMIPHRPGET